MGGLPRQRPSGFSLTNRSWQTRFFFNFFLCFFMFFSISLSILVFRLILRLIDRRDRVAGKRNERNGDSWRVSCQDDYFVVFVIIIPHRPRWKRERERKESPIFFHLFVHSVLGVENRLQNKLQIVWSLISETGIERHYRHLHLPVVQSSPPVLPG